METIDEIIGSSRLRIDAHLCRRDCAALNEVHWDTGKGIIFLALYIGEEIFAVFLKRPNYEPIPYGIILSLHVKQRCNNCGDVVRFVSAYSETGQRFCIYCDDYFTLERVSWGGMSFTVYEVSTSKGFVKTLVRADYLRECSKHFKGQSEIFI